MSARNILDCQVCDCFFGSFHCNRYVAVITGFLLGSCRDRADVCLATRESLAIDGLVNNFFRNSLGSATSWAFNDYHVVLKRYRDGFKYLVLMINLYTIASGHR